MRGFLFGVTTFRQSTLLESLKIPRKPQPHLRLVRPPGIEPGYAASETTILSVELRARSRPHGFA